jgi:hypothetical protein
MAGHVSEKGKQVGFPDQQGTGAESWQEAFTLHLNRRVNLRIQELPTY